MSSCLRILILNCILISVSHAQAIDLFLDKLEDGLAIVTSHTGEVTFSYPDGRNEAAELHAVKQLTGTQIRTDKQEHLFLSLSNGTGLGIYENSEVRVDTYLQEPFEAHKESIEFEPTRSKLILHLTSGSLTFTADKLSAISEIIIHLPFGQIKTHSASGRVLYDATGIHVTITSGFVTFHYPDTGEKDFINPPHRVRVSEQSAKLGEFAESIDLETDPERELTEKLIHATTWSMERVLFKSVSKSAAIPQPVLIAKPESLEQPSPRPYRYLD